MEEENPLRMNQNNLLDETVFNKILKNDSEIDLIPKSGKYDYVFNSWFIWQTRRLCKYI